MKQYEIEKCIWTDADFERMSWHDTRVYAIAFVNGAHELVLDIDYIFKWVLPAKDETHFKFWIAPATLVFENVYDIDMNFSQTDFELDIIEREEPRKPKNSEYINKDIEWLWSLEAHMGSLSFYSVGFKQYVRKNPIFSQTQDLEVKARGGISFYRGRFDE